MHKSCRLAARQLRLMALTQRLEFRQSQALVMTPQLMQAIKLLQLSNLDLMAYVEEELERNPLLERASEGEPSAPEQAQSDAESSQRAGRRRASRRLDRRGARDQPRRDRGPARHRARQRLSRRRRAPRPPGRRRGAGGLFGMGERRRRRPRATATTISRPSCRPRPTLADHLAEQLALAIADPVRRMIGQYLIDLVDEAGYLAGDLADVAEKLGAPLAEVEAVLGDPAELRSAGRLRAQPRPNASRSSSRSATASIRRWRRWSAVSTCSPSATLRPCAGSAASTTRISPT